MENLDSYPFKDVPASGSSLLELCCRKVAIFFDSYDQDIVSGLPAPVLTALTMFLTPRSLHDLTAVLQQHGIDASPAWEKHVLDALPYNRSVKSYNIDDEDRHHFIVHHKACKFHQKYISLHCGLLLKKLCSSSSKDVEAQSLTYLSLLHFLPSVHCLKMTTRHFIRLLEQEQVLTILVKNLQALVLTGVEYAFEERRKTVVIELLKRFCENRTLKGIVLESHCSVLTKKNNPFLDLLQVFSNSAEDHGNNMVSEEQESDVFQEDDLYDDAVTSNTSVKYSFDDILKQIDLDGLEEGSQKNMDDNSLISVSLNFPHCSGVIVPLLPQWKFLQRLNLEDNTTSREPGFVCEILRKVGCNQFTHLRISSLAVFFFLPQLMYIFCEYYRKEIGLSQPMELLNVSEGVDECHLAVYRLHKPCGPFLPKPFHLFKDEICAVKDLCLSSVSLDELGLTALHTFLQLNSCLTHLRLINLFISDVKNSDGTLRQLTFVVPILKSLMDNKVIKSVSLSQSQSRSNRLKDEERAAFRLVLNDFLNKIQTLQTLRLIDLDIKEDLVTRNEFVEAVQNHPSLNCLSLAQNRLGSGGAQFLGKLFGSNRCQSLKELDISSCNINGKDLLNAAQMLNKTAKMSSLLNKLCINGMLLDDEGLGGILHKKLRHEFEKLTVCLEADYHGDRMADHIANM